tara:strand:+ start:163 stop:900 length:738 start_codon:yes stop_codon:yes gene_type:complete
MIVSSIFEGALSYGLAIAVISGLIHGYTGFGSALVMVPLLTFLFGPVEAVAIVTIIIFLGSVQLYPSAIRGASWRELIPIFVGFAILTPLGAILLINLDPLLIRRAMGAFIIVFAFVLISGWVYRGPRGIIPSALVGALAGWISGSSGVGGPPIALYYLASPHPVEVQRANIVVTVAVLIIVTLISVAVGGGVTIETVLRAIILTPAYVFGIWSGAKLFAMAPKTYFKRIALWLLVVTGTSAVLF